MASDGLPGAGLEMAGPPAGADATYRIVIRNLTLLCSIGAHPHEREARQRVRISAELVVRRSERMDDTLRTVLNYQGIVDGIKAIAGAGHIHLVETLADRLAEFCLNEPRIRGVRVLVEKLDVYPEAESVGVAVERWRAASPDA